MRFVAIIALAAFVTAGCASQKKKDEANKAATTTKEVKADAKGMTKKAETKVKEAAAATASATKVECKNGGDVRILEVRSKDKGCETAYTKAGQENVVGSSQNGTAHCEGIMNRIKDKLLAASFKCE